MLTFDPIILHLELFTKEIIKCCRKNFLWTVVYGNIMEYIVIITTIILEGQQDGLGSKGDCQSPRQTPELDFWNPCGGRRKQTSKSCSLSATQTLNELMLTTKDKHFPRST